MPKVNTAVFLSSWHRSVLTERIRHLPLRQCTLSKCVYAGVSALCMHPHGGYGDITAHLNASAISHFHR